MSESEIESVAKEYEEAEDEDFHEPPVKKCKLELKGVLAGMANVVNKPLHNGENLNADLSILLTDLLCSVRVRNLATSWLKNTQPRESANALKLFMSILRYVIVCRKTSTQMM